MMFLIVPLKWIVKTVILKMNGAFNFNQIHIMTIDDEMCLRFEDLQHWLRLYPDALLSSHKYVICKSFSHLLNALCRWYAIQSSADWFCWENGLLTSLIGLALLKFRFIPSTQSCSFDRKKICCLWSLFSLTDFVLLSNQSGYLAHNTVIQLVCMHFCQFKQLI